VAETHALDLVDKKRANGNFPMVFCSDGLQKQEAAVLGALARKNAQLLLQVSCHGGQRFSTQSMEERIIKDFFHTHFVKMIQVKQEAECDKSVAGFVCFSIDKEWKGKRKILKIL